jgi:2,3-dihydroxy-p-cumate/2,3-dihydroxybenzoate 3,4-dioxygenase
MVRHMLVFSFKPTVGDDESRAMLNDLAAFPDRYTKMRGMQIGQNISHRDNRFSHGMTLYFENEDDLDEYLQSEFHEQFVRERFRPLIAERAIVTVKV